MKCKFRGCITLVRQGNRGGACSYHKAQYRDLLDQRVEDMKHKLKLLKESKRFKGRAERIRKLKKRIGGLYL